MAADQAAAGRFEEERPGVIAAYAALLAEAESPLVATGRWPRVRRNVENVLRECAAGLRGEQPQVSDAALVSVELLGARRALDGIPAEESVRAARFLWQATGPALERALAPVPPRLRDQLRRQAGRAFYRSVSTRLRAGAAGYADHGLIDLLVGIERAALGAGQAPLPTQRTPEAASGSRPDPGAHRRIAAELGVPETPEAEVRTTLRAALRRAEARER
ncbi:hypothetical protein [Streptacidiphilus sp. MAP5-3]|uniref:hypothetical protein n=1 Tax=unclassified Streptacidiphilus TaxID=2643834 RepID=UPI0035165990